MTGLFGLVKTFAIAALAASGLLMTTAQFDPVTPERVSFHTGAKTTAGAESGNNPSIATGADASTKTDLTLDITECADNCPAPCATACADLQRVPSDGAVELGASFDAAVAPEHLCGCEQAVPAVAADSEVEGRLAPADLGAAAGSAVVAGLGGY